MSPSLNIIAGLAYGLLGRYATGEIAVTDILTTLDRAMYWLTAGYEAAHPGDE